MDLCNFFHWRESEVLMYTLTWEIYTLLQLVCITPAFAVIFKLFTNLCAVFHNVGYC